MSRRGWKTVERKAAKALGGRRIPVTGIDRDGADVVAGPFAVQVKSGRRRPGYLRGWLDGICASAAVNAQTGVVVWQATREPLQESVVLMRFSDFQAWHGALSASVEPKQS